MLRGQRFAGIPVQTSSFDDNRGHEGEGIFLNLILSCLTAIQAPIIMMSRNRQEAKDRVRSQHDYQINLKA